MTFWKPLIQKNEYCRELQPGLYFPDAHLLLMADGCAAGQRWAFEDYKVFCWMQMFCPLLSPSTDSVLSSTCLSSFSSKALIFFLWQSVKQEKERERRGKRERIESVWVCFSHYSHGCGSSAVNVWVKKFQALKWSMPQSHDIHLISPASSSVSASRLSPWVSLELLPSMPLWDCFKHPSQLLWTSYCNWPTFVSDLNRW